jgi:hypothetical protein
MYIISCFLWSLIHLLITYPLYHQFWFTMPMFVGESSMSPNEVPLIYHSWLYIPFIFHIYIIHKYTYIPFYWCYSWSHNYFPIMLVSSCVPIIFQWFSPLLLDYFAIMVSTFRLFHGFSIIICW